MASGGPVILSVRGLSVEYRTEHGFSRAARGVSFDMHDGETIGLIGESGSGKSTVAQAILGLLPGNARVTEGSIDYRPSGGSAPIDLIRATPRETRAFRWSACALVPQGAINALNPVMRVAEHFEDTAAAHGQATGGGLRQTAQQLLAAVHLDPDRVWSAYPHELSGGMRQRVLIALALLLSPRILILDEPTTALDVLTQRSILQVLLELRAQRTFATLFISHDLPTAAGIADRVLTMYAGRVVEDGPARFDEGRPRHPYSAALWRAVPTLDGPIQDLKAIPGAPPSLVDLPSGCAFHPRCPAASEVCSRLDPEMRNIDGSLRSACHAL